jgi:hypothetical protein
MATWRAPRRGVKLPKHVEEYNESETQKDFVSFMDSLCQTIKVLRALGAASVTLVCTGYRARRYLTSVRCLSAPRRSWPNWRP